MACWPRPELLIRWPREEKNVWGSSRKAREEHVKCHADASCAGVPFGRDGGNRAGKVNKTEPRAAHRIRVPNHACASRPAQHVLPLLLLCSTCAGVRASPRRLALSSQSQKEKKKGAEPRFQLKKGVTGLPFADGDPQKNPAGDPVNRWWPGEQTD
jgi:hypothetical protein